MHIDPDQMEEGGEAGPFASADVRQEQPDNPPAGGAGGDDEPPTGSDDSWTEDEEKAVIPEDVDDWPDHVGGDEGRPTPGVDDQDKSRTGDGLTDDDRRLDWRDIGIALKEAEGDRAVAARALSVSKEYLEKRMYAIPQLRRIYVDPELTKPSGLEIATRRPGDLPVDRQFTPEDRAQMVDIEDRQMHSSGLLKLGIKQETLDELKTMDGMAKTGAKFLSVSIQRSYQMYSVTQILLYEELKEVKKDLLKPKLTAEEKLNLRRMITDITKELGRGYQLQLQSVAAITSMIAASNSQPIQRRNRRPPKPGKNIVVEATPGE